MSYSACYHIAPRSYYEFFRNSALDARNYFDQALKLAPLAAWTTRDVWYACESLSISLLPLYARGYSSIGCEPCTTLPLDPNDPRSGRWAGRKVDAAFTSRRPQRSNWRLRN